MKRSSVSTLLLSAGALFAVAAAPTSAKADVTLFDHDGWTFYTNGLVAAHYQLISGDADPNARLSLAGGRILDEGVSADESDPENRRLTMSNIRSGFIGTQIGFGVNRQLSQNVRIESLLALNVAGINSNRGQDLAIPKEADYREAWAAIVSPFGTFKFGRMFGVFGEGSAEVMMLAFRYGVGNPCVVNHATISCGSSGAGPIYAGFDSALRYISPRLAGFQFVVSLADPVTSPQLKISPYPRVDTELNFDQTFGAIHVRLIGQSMFVRVGRTDVSDAAAKFVDYKNIWGIMGTGIIDVGSFLTVGGGAWQGAGIGERIPLEQNDPANPLSNDNSGQLRQFRGFYGNAQFKFANNAITVGGGELFVKPTARDKMVQDNFVLTNQYEGHVVLTRRMDAIALNLEFMGWHTDWIKDPMPPDPSMPNVFSPRINQTLFFMGGGVNYFW
jgi:predicted porin